MFLAQYWEKNIKPIKLYPFFTKTFALAATWAFCTSITSQCRSLCFLVSSIKTANYFSNDKKSLMQFLAISLVLEHLQMSDKCLCTKAIKCPSVQNYDILQIWYGGILALDFYHSVIILTFVPSAQWSSTDSVAQVGGESFKDVPQTWTPRWSCSWLWWWWRSW